MTGHTPHDSNLPDENLAQLFFSRVGAIPAIAFSLFAGFWLPDVLGMDRDAQEGLVFCVSLASGPLLMAVAGFTWSIIARNHPVALASCLYVILAAAPFVGLLGHNMFGNMFVTLLFAIVVTPILGYLTIIPLVRGFAPAPSPVTDRYQTAAERSKAEYDSILEEIHSRAKSAPETLERARNNNFLYVNEDILRDLKEGYPANRPVTGPQKDQDDQDRNKNS
ncbi:hypothetical protein FB566_0851 [Stackebrandtia endophytica]|uniref:Uncharacterized protein n=1 Tax=Stackebrandtia endophytica TaxID=1496996 RepID=A0A543ARZ5_9ACTN|nr:hypothetical protein FB566_0851 [Stackebrandtia endophytica]